MSAAAELLLETARRGELHHAILCHGPSAPALREVALGIAKTLNCLNGTAGDDCTACQRIERRLQQIGCAPNGGWPKVSVAPTNCIFIWPMRA